MYFDYECLWNVMKALINSVHLYSVPPYNKEVKYDIAQQITWNEEFTHKLQETKTHHTYYQLTTTHTTLSTHSLIQCSWHYV